MQFSPWLLLTIAIISEVIATAALKASDGFTRWVPGTLVVVGYGISFYALALTMRTLPVGVIYAIWSGLGIVLVTLIGWFVFKQQLSMTTLLGIGLIIMGVVVMNLSSNPISH